jgi:amino acid permease
MAQQENNNANANNNGNENNNNQPKRPMWVRILKWIGIGGGIAAGCYGSYRYGYNKGRKSVQG